MVESLTTVIPPPTPVSTTSSEALLNALGLVVPIPTFSELSIVMAIASALSSIPGEVKEPVNVGLARGALASNCVCTLEVTPST